MFDNPAAEPTTDNREDQPGGQKPLQPCRDAEKAKGHRCDDWRGERRVDLVWYAIPRSEEDRERALPPIRGCDLVDHRAMDERHRLDGGNSCGGMPGGKAVEDKSSED